MNPMLLALAIGIESGAKMGKTNWEGMQEGD